MNKKLYTWLRVWRANFTCCLCCRTWPGQGSAQDGRKEGMKHVCEWISWHYHSCTPTALAHGTGTGKTEAKAPTQYSRWSSIYFFFIYFLLYYLLIMVWVVDLTLLLILTNILLVLLYCVIIVYLLEDHCTHIHPHLYLHTHTHTHTHKYSLPNLNIYSWWGRIQSSHWSNAVCLRALASHTLIYINKRNIKCFNEIWQCWTHRKTGFCLTRNYV